MRNLVTNCIPLLLLIMTLALCSCRNKEEATIDPCVSCRDENNFVGEYCHKECIDNRCQCPPGTIDLGKNCIKDRKGILKADLKGTPLECFEGAVLELKLPEKSESSWTGMQIHYLKPFEGTSGGPRYDKSGINISTSYTVGEEYDVIEDNFFVISSKICDSASAVATNAKILAKYYKKLDVMDIRFIRWTDHPVNVVDTFHVIFK